MTASSPGESTSDTPTPASADDAPAGTATGVARRANRGVSRRGLLKTVGAGVVAGAGATAGATGSAAAQEIDYGGWFSDVSNFDGTEDFTDQDTVEITVGAEGNNGTNAYGPPAVLVTPGTTIRWLWDGSGLHNVVADDGSFESGSAVSDREPFEVTFDETGIHKYYCTPHQALGMKGAVVVREQGGGGSQGSSGTPSSPDYGGWFSDVSNFDGTEDFTDQDTVEITVGAEGNNGTNAYGPPAVFVTPGTTVRWVWDGSGIHNVVADDGSFESGSAVSDREPFEVTFDETGIHKYYCTPHQALGMKGAVVVRETGGGDGSQGPTGPPRNPDYGGWFSGVSNFDGTVDRLGQDTVSVDVGAEGNNGYFAFGPAAVRVSVGTTVRWEWTGRGSTHNVVAEDGTFDSGSAVQGDDVTYEYTFEEPGMYKYVCTPHETLGMKGAIVVGAPPEDGGSDAEPVTPGLGIGGASVLLAFGAPLLYALHARRSTGPSPDVTGPVETTEPAAPEREIDHDDYDPVGTAALIVAYFLILVVMWIFMYFVEFLGRVSIIG